MKYQFMKEFQSAPLTEARGDQTCSNFLGWRLRRFNPLPSPKQGETNHANPCHQLSLCFNPLPSPKQGETQSIHRPWGLHKGFNPLPSPKQGETQMREPFISAHTRFQSAPLTEARGDWCPSLSSAATDRVSIRSPHRSKGRPLRGAIRPP